MSEVGHIRETADGGLEILVSVEHSAPVETWEPYVSVFIRTRPVELPDGTLIQETIERGLIREGWIPPHGDVTDHVCGSPAPAPYVNAFCLKRPGHAPEAHDNGSGLRWSLAR